MTAPELFCFRMKEEDGLLIQNLERFLKPNYFVDSDHPAIIEFARRYSEGGADPVSNAIRLYYAIRDGFRYNPWNVKADRAAFKASNVLQRDRDEGGHCIDKANLLAACVRVLEIPSRLHFANVRNHLGSEAFEEVLGTDLLVFHGYVELYLDGRWVAATPAFNKELCDHLGVDPLEFDGKHDSVFQEYDRRGGLFMEYVHDYGAFPDVPFDLMMSEWRKYYPAFRTRGLWPSRNPFKTSSAEAGRQ